MPPAKKGPAKSRKPRMAWVFDPTLAAANAAGSRRGSTTKRGGGSGFSKSARKRLMMDFSSDEEFGGPSMTVGGRAPAEVVPSGKPIPPSIVLETSVYLQPMDLLNLARTNKGFQSLLMSKSAAPYWRAARANVAGLPDCPSFLSEPAYANLAFSTHCHGCLKPNITGIHWSHRVRYCNTCKPILTASENEIHVPGIALAPLLSLLPIDILPFGSKNERTRVSRRDFHDLSAKLIDAGNDENKIVPLFAHQQTFVQELTEFAARGVQWQQSMKPRVGGKK